MLVARIRMRRILLGAASGNFSASGFFDKTPYCAALGVFENQGGLRDSAVPRSDVLHAFRGIATQRKKELRTSLPFSPDA